MFKLLAALLFSFHSLNKGQMPILCYHQIRDWKTKDSKADKAYIIPPAAFDAQMKMLSDRGYHTILPDQLYDYLTTGKALPSKPIMLTFDDTNADQFTAARPVLLKYHFKAVYFIITGKIGTHKWFMNRQQIKQLSDEGNVIGCHSRNHNDFRKLKGADWQVQIAGSKHVLETITGKPVAYFAFPYGSWYKPGLPELHRLGFKAAFALEQPRDPQDPMMTIRRLIASGYWDAKTPECHIRRDFGPRWGN
jgi:peptidoglycan/xylan/chitin deacetylase (PgdA/CDA1 family)